MYELEIYQAAATQIRIKVCFRRCASILTALFILLISSC
jgi:hypothetical protein